MKKVWTGVLCILLAVSFLPAASALDTSEPAEKALSYYQEHRSLGSWWDIVALAGSGVDVKSEGYEMPALSPLDGGADVNALAVRIITRMALNEDPRGEALSGGTDIADALISLQKADGSFGDYLNQHVYAVLALEAAAPASYNRDAAEAYLLSQQKTDGGFAFYGDEGDVDMTGMALLAVSCFTDEQAVSAADRAVRFLESARDENGGYVSPWSQSGKESACSAAAALSGLAAAGETFSGGKWDKTLESLLGCQLENGSFAAERGLTETDAFSTQQALIALNDVINRESVFRRLPYRLPEQRRRFSDGHKIGAEYAADVLKANDSGIMLGNTEKEFLPQKPLSRAELAAVLARLSVTVLSFREPPYGDVQAGDWFYPYVAKVSAAGLMTGTDGRFMPYGPVTYGELAESLCALMGIGESSPEAALSNAKERGLIDTSRIASADQNVTREEAAGVFVRVKEKIG